MKKQKSVFEEHFTRKELKMMADFLNMLINKDIVKFTTDVGGGHVSFQYANKWRQKKNSVKSASK